jgi:hypothetical protein
MKSNSLFRIIISLMLMSVVPMACNKDNTINELQAEAGSLIIADHTVVDRYDDIPQRWIDSVKKMLVWIPGMSHGYGYFRGAELLEILDPKFQVDIWLNTSPPPRQSNALRLGRIGLTRESIWTNQPSIDNLLNNIIATQNNSANPYDCFWFGWSYQATWENGLGGGIDPVYNVHWAGSTQGGPEGNLRWGLDAGDQVLTGNSVCMDTYLDAMEQCISYCKNHGWKTKIIFANGAVDLNAGTELGFQREIKNQYIREYVSKDTTLIFFDYADILVHNNSGELYTVNWNDGGTNRPHQQIHPDNLKDYDLSFNIIDPEPDAIEDHIGEVGALRLAKAMWWMLARVAGWEGN